MLRGIKVCAVLLVGLLALPLCRTASANSALAAPVIQAQWYGPGYGRDWERQREHCERMRDRLHEIRDRLGYVPPSWQRREMEQRAFELRQRLRAECWGR